MKAGCIALYALIAVLLLLSLFMESILIWKIAVVLLGFMFFVEARITNAKHQSTSNFS